MTGTWLSDLHLARAPPEAMAHFLDALRRAAPKAVIITGDISNSSRLTDDLEAIADAAAVALMMRSQARRGPDACGQLMRGRVGLGHRRLKIIDLSHRSAQPMPTPRG